MSTRPETPAWSIRYLWRRSVHNLPQKLAALVVAVLVWLVATADRRANIEVGFDVPLEVRDTTGGSGTAGITAGGIVGTGRRVVSNLPATVRVSIRGQRSRVQGLPASAVEASVDTTGAQEGSFNLPVDVRAPDGTQSVRVFPARVQGFVDSQLSRTLAVTLSAAAPPPGSLPRYTLSPGSVTLSGPSRLVRTVAQVISTPIALAAGAEGQSRVVALSAQGEPVTGVVISPSRVTVRRSDVGSLPVKTLRVLLPPAPARFRVVSRVSPNSVRVVGPPSVLATLNSVPAVLTYRAGTSRVVPSFRLPAGVQVIDSVTVELKVTVNP